MSVLWSLVKPVATLAVKECFGQAKPYVDAWVATKASERGLSIPAPLAQEVTRILSAGTPANDSAEALYLLEKMVDAYSAGAAIGVGPTETQPTPHAGVSSRPMLGPGLGDLLSQRNATADMERLEGVINQLRGENQKLRWTAIGKPELDVWVERAKGAGIFVVVVAGCYGMAKIYRIVADAFSGRDRESVRQVQRVRRAGVRRARYA